MENETIYSKSWIGQDGREWRTVSYWCSGWQTFLQVKVNGVWQGW